MSKKPEPANVTRMPTDPTLFAWTPALHAAFDALGVPAHKVHMAELLLMWRGMMDAAQFIPGPEVMRASVGDDYKNSDEDHKTFGINVANSWRDIHGNLREHGNMIAVYRSEALRDRIIYLLQTYGFGDASKDIGS